MTSISLDNTIIEGKHKILDRNHKSQDITSFWDIFSAFEGFYCDFVDRKRPCLDGMY